MSDHGPRYGRTLMERIAPDGKWTARSVLWAIPLVFFVTVLLVVLFRNLDTGSVKGILFTFGLLAIFFIALAVMFNNRAANLFGRVLVPQGNSSPYQHDFSFEKSLVMQNRIAEALESYESLIRAHPMESAAYMEAAELNVSKGSVSRGLELFRSVRLLESLSDSQRIYATNRLIDLYLGKTDVADNARARSELHYLIAHFPQSRAAEKAKALVREL